MTPSLDALARSHPLGWNARASMGLWWPNITLRSEPSATLKTRMLRSTAATHRKRLSGLIAMEVTAERTAVTVRMRAPVETFQSFTVASAEPDAKVAPSAELA